MMQDSEIHLLKRMQKACEEAVLEGYEDAKLSGLCHEGAWECAVERLRGLKPAELLKEWQTDEVRPS